MFQFYFDYDIYYESAVGHYDPTGLLVCGHASYSKDDIERIMTEKHKKFNDIVFFRDDAILFKPINKYLLLYEDKQLMDSFYSEFKDLLNMSREEFGLLVELKKGG